MYTDPSVANLDSTFTINRALVSCGVGTGGPTKEQTAFAMIMYSTLIRSYTVDEEAGKIRATGQMRSTTLSNGAVIEDVLHRFVGLAEDGGKEGDDRFDVHFKTEFWNPANPLCTPSDVVEGGCRFGGKLILGDVVVGECGGLPGS